jgi:hypothetical protein
MVAELSMKAALVWGGVDPDSFRKGKDGHDLALLARRMAAAWPHRDDGRLQAVVAKLPPYVASRYKPAGLKRLQVVRLALGVQFIAKSYVSGLRFSQLPLFPCRIVLLSEFRDLGVNRVVDCSLRMLRYPNALPALVRRGSSVPLASRNFAELHIEIARVPDVDPLTPCLAQGKSRHLVSVNPADGYDPRPTTHDRWKRSGS